MKTRWLALATFVGLGLFASVGALLILPVGPALGVTTLPAGFTDSPVVSGLTNPTDMEIAPDGRLFITEDAGKVRIAKSDGTLATLLNFSSRIDPSGERGLLAITFDPDYSTNHYVYLHFTKKATSAAPVHNRVVRVAVGANDRIVAGSEKLIFRLGNQSAADQMPQYMGGALDFGRDGKLYVVTGYDDTATMAQQLTNLFGKMLRINKDGTIPTDNPFYATTSGKQRAIWALGLRNPFKFAVQPGTGTIYINDVGEHDWEEINHGEAGANFGWPVREGVANDPSYDDPISAYGHGGDPATTGCAITGGTFYNPTTLQFPSQYEGDYFFADFCSGWIRTLDPTSGEASGFATGLERPIDLEVSKTGELYYLAKGTSGSPAFVGKIGYAGS